jgi:hypothetical protein
MSSEIIRWIFNPLNNEINPICYMLKILGAHHILHAGVVSVNNLPSQDNHYVRSAVSATVYKKQTVQTQTPQYSNYILLMTIFYSYVL